MEFWNFGILEFWNIERLVLGGGVSIYIYICYVCVYIYIGLRFRISSESGNILYRDYIGSMFPYTLLTTSKYTSGLEISERLGFKFSGCREQAFMVQA